jgi:glutathione S-transferase
MEEIGLSHEWQPTSTLDGSNRTPEYLAINPSGKIPAMADDDVVMTESMAINLYLAQTYGQGGLWPGSAKLQAKVLQWTMWSATELEYYIGALFTHLVLKSEAERDQALVDRLLKEMMPKLNQLDACLEGKAYVLDAFTLADISVAVQTFVMTDRFGMDLREVPNVRAWNDRCRARPARQKIESLAAAAKKKPDQ